VHIDNRLYCIKPYATTSENIDIVNEFKINCENFHKYVKQLIQIYQSRTIGSEVGTPSVTDTTINPNEDLQEVSETLQRLTELQIQTVFPESDRNEFTTQTNTRNVTNYNSPRPHYQAGNVGQTNYYNNSCYSKLPNPMERFLREIPHTDGLRIQDLLKFITIAIKIKTCLEMPDAQLFQLLFPYSHGLLSEKIQKAMKLNSSFDTFHADLIYSFIPSRMLSLFEQERFYRLQNEGEPLSTYIHNIRENAQVLRLNKSECQIVDTILEGLNPLERQRILFQNRPRNFAELDDLCIHAQNFQFADMQRKRMQMNFERQPQMSRTINENRNNKFQVQPTQGYKVNSRPNQNQVKCFTCNKMGHIARNCYRNRSSNPSTQNSKSNR
jgi:hypothetical protein